MSFENETYPAMISCQLSSPLTLQLDGEFGRNVRTFNPCFAEDNGEKFLIFRMQSERWPGSLFFCKLDEDYMPVSAAQQLQLPSIGEPEHVGMHEDPRWARGPGASSILTMVTSSDLAKYLCYVNLVELRSGFAVEKVVTPDLGVNASARKRAEKVRIAIGTLPMKQWRVEKNWQTFIHDDHIYVVYSIFPHIVACFRRGESRPAKVFKTRPLFSWSYGRASGGANPVLVDDRYYSFFHSWTEWNSPPRRLPWQQRIYHVGLYTFSSKPPFQMLEAIGKPVFSADDRSDPGPEGHSVVFPGGALLKNGVWRISVGWNDKECRYLLVPHEELRSSLTPLQADARGFSAFRGFNWFTKPD